MMRKLRLISILLLLAAFALGCMRDDILDTDSPQLNIFIDIPQPVLTKADVGPVASETAQEYAIHTLQIWVFLSEACGNYAAGYCLGYIKPSPLYFNTASGSDFAFPINADIAEAHPNVDVFVIANAESAGYANLDGFTSRAQLEALIMNGELYGTTGSAPSCTSVPGSGLPFTGVGKNMRMKGTFPVLKVDAVRMTRAVSKMRFVFSQLVDEDGPLNECEITDVRINNGGLALSEYLFNDTANPYKIGPSGYASSPMVFSVPDNFDIAGNSQPEDYAYKGQTAQEYSDLVAEGIDSGVLSQMGLCYLRETDRKITGSISYYLNGLPGTVNFEMRDTGDFARNHYWIVYLYFTRDAIEFTVSWTPWEEGHDYYLN